MTGHACLERGRTESTPDLTQAGRGADEKPCHLLITLRGAPNRACQAILAKFNIRPAAHSRQIRRISLTVSICRRNVLVDCLKKTVSQLFT